MEPTSAAAVKAGMMVATGSLMADAVIFSDISYLYLAIVGAFVSTFGVIHEIYGIHTKAYSASETIVEVVKGMALGILAIPFWFLILTSIGDDLLLKYLEVTPDPSTFTSLSLIIAFGLAWFTVPIFDFVAKTAPSYIKSSLSRGK